MAKYTYVMNEQDTETRAWAGRLSEGSSSNQLLVGGAAQLGQVQPTEILAVMAHGTAEAAVSVKEGNKRRWTPAELADQLQKDGLSQKHRVLELLVCEAASSTNTVQGAAELGALRMKYLATTDPAAKAAIEKKFKEIEAKSPRVTDMSKWTAKNLLPFGAAFIQEMKNRHYDFIRVYCYKHPVSSHFTGGRVWLQDPAKGDRPAKDEDKVQWL
jgi:hypothetical protein